MEKYKHIFHWNLQDASTISSEAIIFLHDYIMLYLIIIIVIIMILQDKPVFLFSFELKRLSVSISNKFWTPFLSHHLHYVKLNNKVFAKTKFLKSFWSLTGNHSSKEIKERKLQLKIRFSTLNLLQFADTDAIQENKLKELSFEESCKKYIEVTKAFKKDIKYKLIDLKTGKPEKAFDYLYIGKSLPELDESKLLWKKIEQEDIRLKLLRLKLLLIIRPIDRDWSYAIDLHIYQHKKFKSKYKHSKPRGNIKIWTIIDNLEKTDPFKDKIKPKILFEKFPLYYKLITIIEE